MQIKTFLNIFSLFFLFQIVEANDNISSNENVNLDLVQSVSSTIKKPFHKINLSQLLESVYPHPEGFEILDPIRKILNEEKTYQTLDDEAKNQYLYNRYEKMKNFSEKNTIEKFLNFDFKTGRVNSLSNDVIKNLNQHLPYYINEARLQSQAFQAATSGDLYTLRALLDNGKIDINVVDNNNITLLMYAAKNNQVNLVRFLIGRGINVKQKDKLGNSVIAYTTPNSVTYNLLSKFIIK